ncbi:WD40/YVTN/BNR-like repeat-containing protein [Sphingomonas sp. ID0503]|uniref:WD40/YVTN/BNR-like repeat-containing protein n=1 Tax=Sphingomonas sp. ID0503 TaxID=3399691 RepID=UPI003AFA8CC0
MGIVAAIALAATLLWAGRGPAEPLRTPPAASPDGKPVKDERYLWRPVAIGAGGFVVGLSADRAGKTFVARTDVYGAYIWQPKEDRWDQLVTASAMPERFRTQAGLTGGVTAIAVAPSDGRRLYMEAGGTVFHSEDRGAHWAAPENGPFPVQIGHIGNLIHYDPILTIDPANPDLALFGTPFDGIWRTADGGRTWQRAEGIPAPLVKPGDAAKGAGTPIWFVPGTAEIWAAVPGQGLFVSRDGGASFTGMGAGPKTLAGGAFTKDGSFFGADPVAKALWRRQGGSWTNLTAEGLLDARKFGTVAVNPADGAIFTFDQAGRGWRSTDQGASWQTLSHNAAAGEGDPPWLHVADQSYFATSQVMFDPVRPNRLWVSAGTGVFYADLDGSRTIDWISRSRGIEELVTNDVIQPPGLAPLFAAWDFGIHVKPDLNRFSTTYGPRERVIIAAQQIVFSPADPKIIITNASDTRPCCSEDGDAVMAGYSEDGGQSWRKFASLPTPPGTQADDPWRMSFGTIAVSSGDPDNIVWVPSFNRAPFYTRDRGRSWERVSFPGERLPFTGSHPAKHLQRKILVADPVQAGTFYLAHSGNRTNPQLAGLWKSEDGGARWTRLFEGEIAPSSGWAAKLRAVPGFAGHLFFTSGVMGKMDTRLRRSIDGGATWLPLNGITEVDDVAFGKAAPGAAYPTIFVSAKVDGEYGIWRSVDEAESWQRVGGLPLDRLDRVTVLGADPDVFGRVYIGLMGSSWVYGEPAHCAVKPVVPFSASLCLPVVGQRN